MTFSLAAIPLPVLIAVPIVGVVAAVIIYEVEKNKKAAAAQQPVVAKAPVGATGPVTAGSVAAAAQQNIMGISKGGTTTWLTPSGPVSAPTGTAPPAAAWGMTPAAFSAFSAVVAASPSPSTGFGPQIVAAAQQAYAAIGAQPAASSDVIGNFNWQVVAASLSQLQNNPTSAQLSSAMSTIEKNGSSYANTAYPILSRVWAIVST